jgi:CHAT domain-containing protein
VSAFFRSIAAAERGNEPPDYARSLAAAKRSVRAQPVWSDPFFWAPFILDGAR